MKRLFATFSVIGSLVAGAALGLGATLGASPAVAEEKPSHPDTAAGVEAVKRGDFKAAFALFRNRAAKGDTEAQFELGMLYALGNGVDRDYVAAYMWTEIAAQQNEPYADFIRDEVAANMKPPEIASARREANAWMRQNGK